MPRLESAIQANVRSWALMSKGIESVKLKDWIGCPDVLFFIRGGRPLLIEFKQLKRGRLSALQPVVHQRLRAAGYDVQVHSTIEGAKAAILAAQAAANASNL